jgi:hypothetical protein
MPNMAIMAVILKILLLQLLRKDFFFVWLVLDESGADLMSNMVATVAILKMVSLLLLDGWSSPFSLCLNTNLMA